MLLTCSYKGQEFIRVGYFINNEYSDPEMRENLPSPPQFDKVSSTLDIAVTFSFTTIKILSHASNDISFTL